MICESRRRQPIWREAKAAGVSVGCRRRWGPGRQACWRQPAAVRFGCSTTCTLERDALSCGIKSTASVFDAARRRLTCCYTGASPMSAMAELGHIVAPAHAPAEDQGQQRLKAFAGGTGSFGAGRCGVSDEGEVFVMALPVAWLCIGWDVRPLNSWCAQGWPAAGQAAVVCVDQHVGQV